MSGQKPTVGRTVHYVSYGTPGGEYGKECRAAIVTAVDDGTATLVDLDTSGQVTREQVQRGPETVSLCVLNPTGLFFNQGVKHDQEGHVGGSWHWPEMDLFGDGSHAHKTLNEMRAEWLAETPQPSAGAES